MDSKKYIFVKEEEKVSSDMRLPRDFIDRGKNCFVGVFYDAQNDQTIIGVPKYYQTTLSKADENEKQLILKHMKLICSVIEQIRLDSNYADYRYNPYQSNEEAKVNKKDLAEYLICDYLENGIYGLYQNCYVNDGSGIYDWSRTVENVIPIINEEMVIYDPVIGRKSQYNQNDIISKIHAAVLKEVIGLLIEEEYQYIQIHNIEEIDYGEDLSLYLSALYQRINITYTEREKNLLKALIAWCGLTINNEKYYIGSTSFEHIWEYAIDKVFGNIVSKKSGVPFYFKRNSDTYTRFRARGDMIPDSLRIEDKGNAKYFHILDAKYYVWEENDKDKESWIEHAPANSDISKQIGYYYYLKKLYGSKLTTFTNSFLVPAHSIVDDDNWVAYWGYAQQNGTQDKEITDKLNDLPTTVDLEKVSVFVVNPTRLYKMFLSNSKASQEFLNDTFRKIDKSTSGEGISSSL